MNVFYTPKMVADSESPSPSAAKPAKVVASWQKQFNITIVEPTPVTLEELQEAHDANFVRDILNCSRKNGFENTSKAVAMSLTYTSGSMLSAARHALANTTMAAAPCSGFHHAEYNAAMGYCTFNGLMVTAFALKKSGVNRVGILDLDMHYGNGTDDIIRVRNVDWIQHFTGGAEYRFPFQAEEFFTSRLPEVLESMSDCDIVLYQAGADPHINDPHGGWLTTEQLKMRDMVVFTVLSKKKIPVAWNLAGGYQVEADGSIPKVLEIHDNTMSECIKSLKFYEATK